MVLSSICLEVSNVSEASNLAAAAAAACCCHMTSALNKCCHLLMEAFVTTIKTADDVGIC